MYVHRAPLPSTGKQRPGEHCAPSFTSPLRDSEVAEGSALLLTAEVAGNPLPDISWTRDGAPLAADERVFTGFDGEKVRRRRAGGQGGVRRGGGARKVGCMRKTGKVNSQPRRLT